MAEDAGAAGLGCCCICCVESLQTWCWTRPGGDSSTKQCCGGPRGCCGSCFESNEDPFEREMEKERKYREEVAQREAAENAVNGKGAISSQPARTEDMQAPAATST